MARVRAPGNSDLPGRLHILGFRTLLSPRCFSRPLHLRTPRPSARRSARSAFQPLITYELPDEWYLASNEATWTWNFRHNTSTSIPFSAGVGKLFRFSDDAVIKTELSGEWMLYRQFDPQEEQLTLKFELTLLLPQLQG